MQSALHVIASTTIKTMTTGLHYLGSNDTIYNELLSPVQQTTISDLILGIGSSISSGVTAQCDENFDHMERFMILTPSQTIAITILAVTICTFTVLENLMVLCVILHSHTLRSRPSYYFIGSLAMADLISSIIFVYSFLDFHVFRRKDSHDVFLFKLGGVNAAFSASVGSLFLTAIDRLICLHRPMVYKHIVTKAKAVIAFSMMWSISIAISLLPLLGWNCKRLNSVCSGIYPFTDHKYQMFWISMISVLFLFIIYAYVSILWKAHQHTVHMRFSQRNVVVSVPGSSVQLVRPEQARIDLRLAKTLVLLLAALGICWGPVLTIMVYDLFWEVNDFTKTVFAFCTMLCLLNSTVNPVIYAMRSTELRRAFVNMCKVCRGTDLPLDNTGESNYHSMTMTVIGPACTAGEDTNGKTTETTEEPV